MNKKDLTNLEYFYDFCFVSYNHAGTKDFFINVGLFFNRKGIDDELVQEAWDLIQVEGVLSE